MDLTKESFDGVEDVQTFTLQPSQLAVVIASYDKTIGMTLYNVTGIETKRELTCRCTFARE